MAKEPKQANSSKIEFDALTKKLVPDPSAIPDDNVVARGDSRPQRGGWKD